MTSVDHTPDEQFNNSFDQVVQLGNRLANNHQESDLWDVADGLLAGAVQFWLYSRQPCGDPRCDNCASVSTAQTRFAEMQRLIRKFAEDSEYFHSPNDLNAGRA